MKDKFTVCVLLYGDHADLAARCINSICHCAPEVLPAGLRIGLNEPSDQTRKYVDELVTNGWAQDEHVYEYAGNIHKYPMMRRMFYGDDSHQPITTPYTMWFDDDSFIKPEMQGIAPGFLRLTADVMEGRNGKAAADLTGAVYTININSSQVAWIKDQPWFAGRPVQKGGVRFVTGGWWTARTASLHNLDYPWEILDHRGGDVMLSVAMEQSSREVRNFRAGVAINADIHGQESQAPRRGFNQKPIGYGYVSDPAGQRPSPRVPDAISAVLGDLGYVKTTQPVPPIELPPPVQRSLVTPYVPNTTIDLDL